MKNRKAKKGFTIIELVIVIAVIGILAGVLIPTFSNVINNANETAAMEEAKNAYTNFLTEGDNAQGLADYNFYIKVVNNSNTYYFQVENGQFTPSAANFETSTTISVRTVENGSLSATATTESVGA